MEDADGAGAGVVGLEYWLQWQVAVCALIFLIPAAVSILLIYGRRNAKSDGADLWIPCWGNLHPSWLLIYRAGVLFTMSWMLYLMVNVAGAFAFYFYTQWTFTLVIVYFALGTVISARGCWNFSKYYMENEERNSFLTSDSQSTVTPSASKATKFKATVKLQRHQERQEIDQRVDFCGYMMQTTYQICAGAVMLTDIVFWCLIVPFLVDENFKMDLLIASMHILNAAFLLIDTALNNMPLSWFGLTYFILWSCLYVIFQWVLHACGFTWWPYPFLELSTPWAPLWYLALALVHIPCYGLYLLAAKAKNSAFQRFFPTRVRRS